jgi:hypothetical protein
MRQPRGAGVRRQGRQTVLCQRGDLRAGERFRPEQTGCGTGGVCFLGGLAGLDGDSVGGEGTCLQGGGDAGDDVLVRHRAVQQQDLDERPGAFGVTMGFADRRPPGVMDRGEFSGRPGLVQCSGPGQGTWFAHQSFQIVVQLQTAAAPGGHWSSPTSGPASPTPERSSPTPAPPRSAAPPARNASSAAASSRTTDSCTPASSGPSQPSRPHPERTPTTGAPTTARRLAQRHPAPPAHRFLERPPASRTPPSTGHYAKLIDTHFRPCIPAPAQPAAYPEPPSRRSGRRRTSAGCGRKTPKTLPDHPDQQGQSRTRWRPPPDPHPSRGTRELRPHGGACFGKVRISVPSLVMAIVCSLCAVRQPVALRSVHPSASVTS